MGVVVIESGDVRRYVVGHLNPVTDFVCEQVFRLELVAAVDVSFGWQWSRISRASRRNDG